MTDHRECLACGMQADTAVEVDGTLTFQADAQVCVYEASGSTWVFFHEYGGGPRGATTWDDEKDAFVRD